MKIDDYIKSAVRDAVESVAGEVDYDENLCFVDRTHGIATVNILYIFATLEQRLALPAFDVLRYHSACVLTIANLSSALTTMAKNCEGYSTHVD